MEQNQAEFFTQYLLFPSIVALLTAVASAIASYKATYKLNKNTEEKRRASEASSLVDKILIEVNRLVPLFEKLRTDFDKDNFYSFRNIEVISNARWRLVNLNNNITLLPDKLRLDILETTDTISVLVDELNALENNPVQGFKELKERLDDAMRDDRQFRLELLKMGIFLANDGKGKIVPQYIGQKIMKGKGGKLDHKLQAVDDTWSGLLSGVAEARRQLDNTNADTNRRRDRLVARIIEAQSRLKNLQNILDRF